MKWRTIFDASDTTNFLFKSPNFRQNASDKIEKSKVFFNSFENWFRGCKTQKCVPVSHDFWPTKAASDCSIQWPSYRKCSIELEQIFKKESKRTKKDCKQTSRNNDDAKSTRKVFSPEIRAFSINLIKKLFSAIKLSELLDWTTKKH